MEASDVVIRHPLNNIQPKVPKKRPFVRKGVIFIKLKDYAQGLFSCSAKKKYSIKNIISKLH